MKNVAQICKPSRVEKQIIEAIEGTVTDLGYELWDINWLARERIVRVHISKTATDLSITHSDCITVSKAVSEVIDELSMLGETAYHLEVSSLGSNPHIRTLNQLKQFLECELEFTDISGKKSTAIVSKIETDGTMQWEKVGETGRDSLTEGHISEFQRLRLKEARF